METVLKESMAAQQRYEIAEPSQIAFARRSIGELARGLGFNETIAGELAITVTECGTNLLKHAQRGELLVRPLADGSGIPIEQRDAREVTHGFGRETAPPGVRVYNPAFDVTPAGLITGIVTERGVITPVTAEGIREQIGERRA